MLIALSEIIAFYSQQPVDIRAINSMSYTFVLLA